MTMTVKSQLLSIILGVKQTSVLQKWSEKPCFDTLHYVSVGVCVGKGWRARSKGEGGGVVLLLLVYNMNHIVFRL